MATNNNGEEQYEYYNQELENQAQAVTDYYNLAREQKYTDLLNKEIEMENSKQNALKYTQNQLANQGFASQGYGSSVQAGVYNNYANNIAKAQSDYNFDMAGMRLEEQQQLNDIRMRDSALKQEDFNTQYENILGLIEGAETQEDINNYLSKFKYDKIMTEKPKGMSDYQWNMMKLVIEEKEKAIEDTSYNLSDLKNQESIIYTDSKGEERNMKDDFSDKVINALDDKANNKEYSDGSVIKVSQPDHVVYLKYNNGKYMVITENEYNEAKEEEKNYISFGVGVLKSGKGSGKSNVLKF